MAKLSFTAVCAVPDDVTQRNKASSHRLGLPEVGQAGPVRPRLAVIGGGPSLGDHLDDLKAWDGEIWAVNGAFGWALDNGLDATFYTIDASPSVVLLCQCATRAVLSDSVDPVVFDALSDAHVEIAKLGEGLIENASTSAATAPIIAAHRGHTHVTLFGCESSFGDQSHAYKDARSRFSILNIRCGGEDFLTNPQFLMQAEFLAEIVRAVPNFVSVEGGGLLPALIKHGDYDVTHISRDLHERLVA